MKFNLLGSTKNWDPLTTHLLFIDHKKPTKLLNKSLRRVKEGNEISPIQWLQWRQNHLQNHNCSIRSPNASIWRRDTIFQKFCIDHVFEYDKYLKIICSHYYLDWPGKDRLLIRNTSWQIQIFTYLDWKMQKTAPRSLFVLFEIMMNVLILRTNVMQKESKKYPFRWTSSRKQSPSMFWKIIGR